ncbi:MAG: ABC transporter permease [Candidatus Omnitrophica bacterium]|nr:ABC transporter permease [Candidatus Omnitrophota bacterium]MCM8809774.1 ABC transporter permease [Candidatus Omnitrophota bacterium]MCM8810485.1 ABC transporter permease [Candidatus Omnitrophota bacterium]
MISYNFFLAKKFIGNKRQDRFLWFISFFTILGISIGVITLLLVIGVMNGFSNDLKRKIIGANPLITIEGKPYIYNYEEIIEKIKNLPEIKGASPYIMSQAIYKSNKYIIGGIIKGIDPERELKVTNIKNFIKKGKYEDIENGIILGKELANELGVDVNDFISIILGFTPRERILKVVGIVEYGVYSFDVSMGFVSLKNLIEIYGVDRVHGVGIKINDIYRTPIVSKEIKKILKEEYNISTWIEKNKILFSAIALEKKAMAIILSLIVIVASFNILSTLMISVYRKVKEIGILKAIGLTSGEIKKIFLYQGIYLGIKGLIFGMIFGFLIASFLKKYNFITIPEFVYDISKLPIEITFFDTIWIFLLVIFVSCIASIYPAQRASKLNPAEAIRNE